MSAKLSVRILKPEYRCSQQLEALRNALYKCSTKMFSSVATQKAQCNEWIRICTVLPAVGPWQNSTDLSWPSWPNWPVLYALYKFVSDIRYVASFRNYGPGRQNFALFDTLPVKIRGGQNFRVDIWGLEQSSTLLLHVLDFLCIAS